MTNDQVAVVGAGYWGRNLIRNFHQLDALKTICDDDPNTLTELRNAYPRAHTTADFESVLNDPGIRAVVIATPAVLHFEFAEKALRADKDVFVEKPLSLTCRDGKELVRVARERKKILFVGHVLQYHAAVVTLKKMIREGRIGRLQYIYSRRLSLGKIRREENILWSFAPHDLSVILSITGEAPSFVESVGNSFLHAQIPDVTVTNLKFPSGIGAHVFVSWLNPFKEQRLVVVGSSGMLVFDDTEPVERKLVFYPHTINWQNGIPVPHEAQSVPIDISTSWKEPLRAECEAFLTAVRTGEPPITSGEEGLRVLSVLELSQQSMEQKEKGRAGVLSPAAPGFPDVFIHPTTAVDDNVSIGRGTKVWHFSHLLAGSRIGSNCTIGQNVVIGPDVTIGNGCRIQNNVSVYKGVTLEDGVFCGPSMVFTNILHPRAEIFKMDQVRPTRVQRGATIGANATILCGHTIGQYAFVGAGAVVTKDVPDYALVAGNPARQIGRVCKCGEKLDDQGKCSACG